MNAYIGTPTSRVDGRAKVTGAAKYAGEFPADELVHGFVVEATIPRGRIARLDTSEALKVTGVLDVLTHANRPPLADKDEAWKDEWRRKKARPSARYMTTRSSSTASRSHWSSRRTGKPRNSPRRWCGSNISRSRLCDRSRRRAQQGRREWTSRTSRAATPQQRLPSGRAPRGGLLHSDRASQSDGALCTHGGLGRQWQAHGLRQDARRPERPQISMRRVRQEAR